MPRWEYCYLREFSLHNTNQCDLMFIDKGVVEKVSLFGMYTRDTPDPKRKEMLDKYIPTFTWPKGRVHDLDFSLLVVDALGRDGWELFENTNGNLYFKRPRKE